MCKKENATLIIAKLDRLSRKVSFLFNLRDSGINFIALDCPDFNTLSLGIFASLAQSERELISQRTKLALAEKKKKGFKLGRPNATIKKEWRELAYHKAKEKAYHNENNNLFVTSRCCKFTVVQVNRLIKMYNLKSV